MLPWQQPRYWPSTILIWETASGHYSKLLPKKSTRQMRTLIITSMEYTDKPQHECGVFGIATLQEDAARQTFFGIFSLQHRGQESAGIAVSDGTQMRLHKDLGLVNQVFDETTINRLKGNLAIGHNRYSTTGSSSVNNAQPFQIDTRYGPLAIAHNGNLVNAGELRKELLEDGIGLSSSSDTEVMLMMLARDRGENWMDRIANCMVRWKGAYSIAVLTLDGVFAARDPWGLRPLTVGRHPGGGHAVASETGALSVIGCSTIREVKPGEIISLRHEALIVKQALPSVEPQAKCSFEHIYFSRPDSIMDGMVVHDVREKLGRQLAQEVHIDADVVVPVPDSSIPAALAFAKESGIPYNIGLLKNRYIGRTFIQPSREMRQQGVNMKYSPITSVLEGKRVILVDDSIVRGTTSLHLINLVKDAGAAEVHMLITCPPIIAPCYMGVDMSTHEELIAYNHTIEEVTRQINADSLHYISLAGMMKAFGAEGGYCNACFTGKYPFKIEAASNKHQFEIGVC